RLRGRSEGRKQLEQGLLTPVLLSRTDEEPVARAPGRSAGSSAPARLSAQGRQAGPERSVVVVTSPQLPICSAVRELAATLPDQSPSRLQPPPRLPPWRPNGGSGRPGDSQSPGFKTSPGFRFGSAQSRSNSSHASGYPSSVDISPEARWAQARHRGVPHRHSEGSIPPAKWSSPRTLCPLPDGVARAAAVTSASWHEFDALQELTPEGGERGGLGRGHSLPAVPSLAARRKTAEGARRRSVQEATGKKRQEELEDAERRRELRRQKRAAEARRVQELRRKDAEHSSRAEHGEEEEEEEEEDDHVGGGQELPDRAELRLRRGQTQESLTTQGAETETEFTPHHRSGSFSDEEDASSDSSEDLQGREPVSVELPAWYPDEIPAP
ncbi:unnamed protein product, partial [Polarella glacialis]